MELQPSLIWKFFEEICGVPRPSKKEEKMIAYLKAFADHRNLDVYVDKAGNVLISKPATPGYENRKPVILQSHMDMVCEKNRDVIHDFEKDPISTYVDGEWMRAKGTTLGADCGIGVATQLSILSSAEVEHGPVECLFTVDEETGLTGAFALEPNILKGSVLLNLDSEEEGITYIGCAGGIDTLAVYPKKMQPAPTGYFPIEISISGLLGGHSGSDIDKGRGNSIKILTRFLWNEANKFDLKMASIEGGNLRNAIPREASALILVPMSQKENVVADFNNYRCEIIDELGVVETNLSLDLGSADAPEFVLADDITKQLLSALFSVPHGVLSMSNLMPGMVATSTNLASIKNIDDEIVISTSQRSEIESSKTYAAAVVCTIFKQNGATVKQTDGYPGWTPNPQSEILKVVKDSYLKLFGQQLQVRSIHAGLECGLFLKKYPALDMVSFGPTLEGVHSPDERLHIGSVLKFWTLLCDVLKNIPEV